METSVKITGELRDQFYVEDLDEDVPPPEAFSWAVDDAIYVATEIAPSGLFAYALLFTGHRVKMIGSLRDTPTITASEFFAVVEDMGDLTRKLAGEDDAAHACAFVTRSTESHGLRLAFGTFANGELIDLNLDPRVLN